ncbi:MAG: hypothetical protein QW794_07565 [Thermosphaera sp.]
MKPRLLRSSTSSSLYPVEVGSIGRTTGLSFVNPKGTISPPSRVAYMKSASTFPCSFIPFQGCFASRRASAEVSTRGAEMFTPSVG